MSIRVSVRANHNRQLAFVSTIRVHDVLDEMVSSCNMLKEILRITKNKLRLKAKRVFLLQPVSIELNQDNIHQLICTKPHSIELVVSKGNMVMVMVMVL